MYLIDDLFNLNQMENHYERSTSEVLRSLEMRIARLERQATSTRSASTRIAYGVHSIDDVEITRNVERVLREKLDEDFGADGETIKDMIELFINDDNVDFDNIVRIIDAGQDVDGRSLYVECEMSYPNGWEGEELWSADHVEGEWDV